MSETLRVVLCVGQVRVLTCVLVSFCVTGETEPRSVGVWTLPDVWACEHCLASKECLIIHHQDATNILGICMSWSTRHTSEMART